MDLNLAIYDSDIIYATRFSLYFKKKKEFDYDISAFTRKESLFEFLTDHNIEILLLGEGIPPEELPEGKIRWICRLIEHPPNRKHKDHPEIYKYQPACDVMAEVLSDYARTKESPQTNNHSELQIISVFSPIPNSAKQVFAWSLSMLLSEQNKVLFVPMELFPVQVLSLKDSDNTALSELIYYLKETPNTITKMKELISYCGNLTYLSGISHGHDLLSLSKEDIVHWLELIKLNTDYQFIIFYLGYYSEAVMELLQHCNSILVPFGSSFFERSQIQEWEKQMGKACSEWKEASIKHIPLPEEDLPIKGLLSLPELHNSAIWEIARNMLES